MRSHIVSHTALRGIAALCVLWGHYTDVFARDVAGVSFFLPHTHLGVDLFFMLSGFVLYHTYATYFLTALTWRRWAAFMRLRLLRIYPLHLATLFAVILLARFELPADGVRQLALHLTLTHAWGLTDVFTFNAPSWSISAEFAAYLLFPLAVLATASIAGRIGLAALIAVFAAVLWHLGDGSLDLAAMGRDHVLLRVAVSFPAGVLLGWVARHSAAPSEGQAGVMQAAALSAGVGCLALDVPEMLMLGAFAVLLFSTARDKGPLSRALSWRPLQHIGAVSYGIYLLQWPIIMLIFNLEPWVAPYLPGLWLDGARLAFMLTALFGAAALSWRWFEAPLVVLGRRSMAAR